MAKVPAGGGATGRGRGPSRDTGAIPPSRNPSRGAAVAASSTAKSAYYQAGSLANKSVSSALNAATAGVGGTVYSMLPKPTDSPEKRAKKKRRLIIIAVLAAFSSCAVVMSPIIIGILMVLMLGGGGAGSGATGPAPTNGTCQTFSAPRVSIQGSAGPGLQPGSAAFGSPLDTENMNVTSGFGHRSIGIGATEHDGLDLSVAGIRGKPIYAVAAGEVREAGPADGYGNWIILRHNVSGQTVDTLYGHIDAGHVLVEKGAHVEAGQHIADVGNAGTSSGPHLHFGVYPGGWSLGGGVDPMPWLAQFKAEAGPTAPSPTSNASPPTTSSTAPADPSVVSASDWEKLAQCEAGGNWSINTGNGFLGGLQFTLQTWEAFGGKEYAASPEKASKQQQMEVANKVLAGQGWGAWPKCSSDQGLTGKKPAPPGTFVGNESGPTTTPQPGSNAGATALPGLQPYAVTGTQKNETLTPEQQSNIKAIVVGAKESGVEPASRAAVIAAVYSANRTNFIAKPYQGTAAGVGIFDQVPLGEDDADNLASNPRFAASEFFKVLARVAATDPAWATKPVGDVLAAMFPEQLSLREEFATWEQLAINAVSGVWEDRYSKPGAAVERVSNTASRACDQGVTGGGLSDLVPERYRKWYQLAGSLCPGVKPALLASQGAAENQFRDGDTSPVSVTGARGPAQFQPETWRTWGTPVDDRGNPTGPPGTGDPNAIPDAVMAQGRFMCALNEQVAVGIREGRIRGDATELTVAAYNAGFGAIEKAGGMPSGGDYTIQTQPYVRKIIDNLQKYEGAPPSAPTTSAGDGGAILTEARKHTGKPYVWGGTGPDGYDCSGLTQTAYRSAGIDLPRTSEEQYKVGTEVPLDRAVPGDLVFSNFGGDGPGHVALYAGNGRVFEASTEGVPIGENPLPNSYVIKHVANVTPH